VSERLDQLLKFKDSRPDDPFIQYAIGIELKNAERFVEAESQLRIVAERFPTYVPTYLHFGQVLEAVGKEDEARSVYQQGLKHANRDPHAASELQAALDMIS
jgi:Flp pilus assembly protein TadD